MNVNNAMGHRHNGFTSIMKVMCLPTTILNSGISPMKHYPSTRSMLPKPAQCTHSGIKVHNEILENTADTFGIVLSKVTAEKNTGADMGKIQYLCYQYDEHSHCYKGAVIKMEGDFTKENLNFYSRKIANWLKSVADSLSK